MTWHNKVMWTEGMFLQPQHFQQQDRFLGRQLDARIAATVAWPWGYVSLQLDDAALLQGRVMLTAARGVLPDGLAFSIPGDDPAPPALEVPVDARDELVVLAVPLSRPGVPDSDVEAGEGSMPPRWRAADVDVADIHAASLREAPLQIGRLNLRLLLARDANEGYTTLGTARIVERRADGRVRAGQRSTCRRCCTRRRSRCSTAMCARCTACCTSAARRSAPACRSPAAPAPARSSTSCCCRP